MKSFDQQQMEYLAKMYELAGNQTLEAVDCNLVDRELGLSRREGGDIFHLLLQKKLIGASLGYRGWLVVLGKEALMKFMEKTYAEEELSVLNTIRKMEVNEPGRFVMWTPLEKALPGLKHSLSDIVNELERKGFLVPTIDEGVKLGPRGYEFLEKQSNQASGVSIHYGHNITSGDGSPITVGDGNTIVNTVTVNPDFDAAIAEITKLVKASSMPVHDMAEAVADLETIARLALTPKEPGILERAMAKIGSLETLLKVAGLASQVAPYLPALGAAFGT